MQHCEKVPMQNLIEMISRKNLSSVLWNSALIQSQDFTTLFKFLYISYNKYLKGTCILK